jgi:5-methylthioadenosine/S-adenosylhomocysteine deaminase
MPHADLILANCTIVTMDPSYSIIQNGAAVITGDIISAVGTATDLLPEYEASDIVDCGGLTLLPGLVNAHTHAPMTLLRGLADDLRLDVWLMGYMMPTEREFVDPEFVYLGTSLGCAEMIRSGITTYCDMYYFENSVAEATSAAGMRGVLGQTVLKFPSPDAESYESGLSLAREFIEKWKGHPLVIPAVAPHAPYTTTPEILQACAALATEYDVPLHIHISETALEVAESRKTNGMPVIPWVKKQGLFDAKVIAAHCVHIDEGEIRTLLHHRAGVAHNPTSNLKLASGIAPVKAMLSIGLNVGIGTDGPASNNDLDMFEETRLAAIVAKVATDDPTSLPARQALEMATIMGARALHMGNLIGSLEPGKRADIIAIDLETVHNSPRFQRDSDSIYSQIVYAAHSSDVCHVICNGAWLMRDRNLLTVDVNSLLTQAQDVARQIDAFLLEREGDVVSKLLALGELQQEESFEVQVKVRLNNPRLVEAILQHPETNVAKQSHYRQYDTYFEFGPPDYHRLRYREDDFLDARGQVESVRTRLTLTSQGKEQEFENAILLSRSRYLSPATRPLRFYREYFHPEVERTIVKERMRWHIDYRGMRLYVNVDKLIDPSQDGSYLEIKSRTWSLKDAGEKAAAIAELLALIGIDRSALIKEEYVSLMTH